MDDFVGFQEPQRLHYQRNQMNLGQERHTDLIEFKILAQSGVR